MIILKVRHRLEEDKERAGDGKVSANIKTSVSGERFCLVIWGQKAKESECLILKLMKCIRFELLRTIKALHPEIVLLIGGKT